MAANLEPQSLWRNRDFLKLWTGQTISLAGSQISFLALPLVAVLVMGATPLQMGLLAALGGLPALFAPLVGPWIDRLPRRPLLIAADLLRAGAILIVPLAYASNHLQIGHLYLVALLLAMGGVVFDIAYGAYLPTLVERQQLVEGNSKLEMSRSVAEVGGPGLAGLLIELLAAPLTLILDALSFVASAISLWLIRRDEGQEATEQGEGFWHELRVGTAFVLSDPILRAAAVTTGGISLCNGIVETAAFLYIPRTLGLGAGLFGLIFSIGSLGALVCATLLPRLSKQLGMHRSLLLGVGLAGLGDLLTALAFGSSFFFLVQLSLGALLFGCGVVLYRVVMTSLRQTQTPDELLGRVGATFYTLSQSAALLGALAGGLLGEILGLQPTLLLGACGELAVLVLLKTLHLKVPPPPSPSRGGGDRSPMLLHNPDCAAASAAHTPPLLAGAGAGG